MSNKGSLEDTPLKVDLATVEHLLNNVAIMYDGDMTMILQALTLALGSLAIRALDGEVVPDGVISVTYYNNIKISLEVENKVGGEGNDTRPARSH